MGIHTQPRKTRMDDKVQARLANLKAKAQGEDSGVTFMEPTAKRGRPKGVKDAQPRKSKSNPDGGRVEGFFDKYEPQTDKLPTEAAPPDLETLKRTIKPAIQAISNVGVKVAESNDAAMSGEEMETILNSAAECVNLYLPAMLSKHANAVVLAVSLGNYSFRVYMLRQKKLEEMRAEFRNKAQSKSVN